GLKAGGVLNIVRHEIELTCPADAIPEQIDIDLKGYEMGTSIHISAVTLPANVKPTITDRDFTIATIAAPAAVVSADNEAKAEEKAEAKSEAKGD
ncbi:MAG: 50S ribosomal protein L25, partial [Parvibaculum sp.]